MSWSREITIWCDVDGCGAWRQEAGVTVAELRRGLAPDGWVHTRAGLDLCPRHRPAGRTLPPPDPLPAGTTAVPVTEFFKSANVGEP